MLLPPLVTSLALLSKPPPTPVSTQPSSRSLGLVLQIQITLPYLGFIYQLNHAIIFSKWCDKFLTLTLQICIAILESNAISGK